MLITTGYCTEKNGDTAREFLMTKFFTANSHTMWNVFPSTRFTNYSYTKPLSRFVHTIHTPNKSNGGFKNKIYI